MSLVIVSLPATAPSDDAENRYLSLLFYGLWETLYNPNFNPLEFEGFRNENRYLSLLFYENRYIEIE